MFVATHLRDWSARAPYPVGPSTIAQVLDHGLTAHPERIALVDGDRSWTWSSLDLIVAEVSGTLNRGDVIAWSLPNSAEMVIGFLATMRTGAVWVGLPSKLSAEERTARTDRAGADRLIADLDIPRDPSLPRPDASIHPHAPAAIAFTSGSTGRPKAIVHSQRSLLGPAAVSLHTEPPSDGERIGTPLDLAILNVMVLGPLSAFVRGSAFVVMRSTRPADLAVDVSRHRITRAFVVPTILHDFVESDVPDGSLASLDRIVAGGSGADPELQQRFARRFGVRPTQSYGLSEAPTGVARESLDDPIGSGRGLPLPHVQLRIGESEEIVVEPSAFGVWAGTFTPMLGYLDDAAETARTLVGDALHTGDTGSLDPDGALRVTGRLSDKIVRGGANIDPVTVERAVLQTPGVRDVAIVGVPDDRLGEVVGALVVVDDGSTVDAAAIEATCIAALSRSEVPSLIVLATEIPRNAMGKPDRAAVRGAITSKRA
ncbi:MAG: class I adenylate-forming enzyme family protein [Acidimicrobiales bacterium]